MYADDPLPLLMDNVSQNFFLILNLIFFAIIIIGNVNEAPPPPPPVVTPTSGVENSINYTAPNLTPETVRHNKSIAY